MLVSNADKHLTRGAMKCDIDNCDDMGCYEDVYTETCDLQGDYVMLIFYFVYGQVVWGSLRRVKNL